MGSERRNRTASRIIWQKHCSKEEETDNYKEKGKDMKQDNFRALRGSGEECLRNKHSV